MLLVRRSRHCNETPPQACGVSRSCLILSQGVTRLHSAIAHGSANPTEPPPCPTGHSFGAPALGLVGLFLKLLTKEIAAGAEAAISRTP